MRTIVIANVTVQHSTTGPEHQGMLEAVKEVAESSEYSYCTRRPKAGLIVHSDRGSQYARKAYRRLQKTHKFIGSMSRKGNCWERQCYRRALFASLKKERVQWRSYQRLRAAQQDLLDYRLMFYNSFQLHSYLDYVSPNSFESAMAELASAELEKAA